MANVHGAGTTLRQHGNDGWASVTEQPNGSVEVIINGNLSVVQNLLIMVNGREVVVPSGDLRIRSEGQGS